MFLTDVAVSAAKFIKAVRERGHRDRQNNFKISTRVILRISCLIQDPAKLRFEKKMKTMLYISIPTV